LIDEVRITHPPDLDWERLERVTLERIARAELGARQAARKSAGNVWVFAAAAAALAMLVANQRGPNPVAPEREARLVHVTELPLVHGRGDARVSYLASAIPRSSAIESGDEPLRFVIPEVASWVLDKESRIVVHGGGAIHRMRLERGTVTAQVVPRHDDDGLVEAFVVEAGGTRVAVHGTVFSVALVADRVIVEVTEGMVSVGRAGYRGTTTGMLLASPARAAFSSGDGRFVELLPRPSADDEPSDEDKVAPRQSGSPSIDEDPTRAARPSDKGASSVQTNQTPADAPPREPRKTAAPAPVEPKALPPIGLDRARAIMVACLSADTAAREGAVQVTVSTQITVQLDDDKLVSSLRFAPPLRTDLQQRCGGALFGRPFDVEGRSASFRIHFATH
jgi:hypothetical protein